MKTRWHLWIGGQEAAAARYVPLYAPHDGSFIAEVGQANAEQAAMAIDAAQAAFVSYKKMSAYGRAHILSRAADLLEQRKRECAEMIALEAAKPIQDALAEMERTVETYRFAAEAAKSLHGEQIPIDAAKSGANRLGFTIRQPIGVVTAITPFNFPFNLVAHKVGPALAAGNTIVVKPAEQTPLSSLLLAEVFHEAGLPGGVLNVIPGPGPELSGVLTGHPHVKKVTFTGSPEVGRTIQQQSGLRKITLELGSNSPLIIDEQTELAPIMERIVKGAFSYNGQVCISIQRIYVHDSLFAEFVRQLTEKAKSLVIGSPLDENTDITAIINRKSLERIHSWVREAADNGAVIECGGSMQGRAYLPTVLTGVSRDSAITCQEIFGPVVAVYPFHKLEEAVQEANRSRYGLNAGIYTLNLQRALYAAQELQTGGVIVNDIPTFRVDNMPYGGLKDSGVGREGVVYSVKEMTEEKFICFRLPSY